MQKASPEVGPSSYCGVLSLIEEKGTNLTSYKILQKKKSKYFAMKKPYKKSTLKM
jgi:hypothetical protein